MPHNPSGYLGSGGATGNHERQTPMVLATTTGQALPVAPAEPTTSPPPFLPIGPEFPPGEVKTVGGGYPSPTLPGGVPPGAIETKTPALGGFSGWSPVARWLSRNTGIIPPRIGWTSNG